MMTDERRIEGLWQELVDVSRRYRDDIVSPWHRNSPPYVSLTRNDVVLRLRERRDLRREFMAACGECDDGYISQSEEKFLHETEIFFEAVKDFFDVTPEEIDAVKLPYTTPSGRKTATSQLPPRLDM